MLKRRTIFTLSLVLIFLVLFTACTGKKTGNGLGDKDATSTEDPNMSLKEPDDIRFFYVTAGTQIPEDFDFADNPILNEIAKLANVRIKEAIVPPWSDPLTKYNLMMASGNICDVVHYNHINAMIVDGKNGAYVELTDFIKNSPLVSEKYAPYIKQLKADDGKIYHLRSLPADGEVNDGMFIRYDLLLDLGYTEIPITFDEWIKVMRELKAKYPDSIPYTSMDNLHWCEFVFNCYGISGKGCGWQPYMGKIIHNFENPLYKDALEVYKMMLNEGLMDPEFVTNKRQDFDDKRYNRNVLINQQNLAASFYFTERFLNNGIFNARPVPCQWAIVDDPRIDPEAVYEGPLPLGGHCVAVASTSQVKDAGLRFLEALLTEETKDLCSWGIENVDYKIVNGKKVVIPEAETPEAIGIWSMLHGYNQKSEVERDFSLAMERLKEETDISDEELNSYEKLCWDQFDKVMADAHTVPTRAMKFIILEADTLSRAQEAESEALTIAIKAMRGDITLEDFDVQAAAFLKKYQFITDEFNEKLPAAKALIE